MVITFTAKLNAQLLPRTEAGGCACGNGHIVTFESINRKSHEHH
jgi:hypothetical protein